MVHTYRHTRRKAYSHIYIQLAHTHMRTHARKCTDIYQTLSLYLSIYLPLYIYLLTYYLPAFTVTRKKEKKRQEQEIKISRLTVRGKKRKNIIGQKKEKKRPTPSHQLKKIKRYAVSWSKEK